MSRSTGNEVFLGLLRAGIRLIGSRLFRRTATGVEDSSEKGQILILTAIAGVALVGILALAVDIGNLYLVRRSAQNVADTAALVGAQDKQGAMPNITLIQNDAVKDARIYAQLNGFNTNSGAANHTWNGEVRVDVPPETGPNLGLLDHIEVTVRRDSPAWFSRIFGANMQVSARAVARAKRRGIDAATVSLDPGEYSTWGSGAASTIVIDGNTYSAGVTKDTAGILTVIGTAFAGGGFGGTVNATDGLVSGDVVLNDPEWDMCGPIDPTPRPAWNSGGIVERQTLDGDGFVWIDPGTYHSISIAADNKVKFRGGVYRVTNLGISINGTAMSAGQNCFVLDDGNTFNVAGTARLDLYSGPVYNYILIWSADDSVNAVVVAGGAGLAANANPGDAPLNGAIYVPDGRVRLAGSSTGTVRGQVVADQINLQGGSGTAVTYDPNLAPADPRPVLVE